MNFEEKLKKLIQEEYDTSVENHRFRVNVDEEDVNVYYENLYYAEGYLDACKNILYFIEKLEKRE